MINIIGNDFNIKKTKDEFVLYIKSKNGKPKIKGYFTDFYTVLRRIYIWRKDKKYPHKEDPKEIYNYMKIYKEDQRKLRSLGNVLNNHINTLNININGHRGTRRKNLPKRRIDPSNPTK